MKSELNQLKEDFAGWRATRKSIRSRTPDNLRKRAVALTESIKLKQLSSELAVSNSTLKSWRKEMKASSTPKFAPLLIPNQVVSDSSSQIQLERPDGVRLTIKGLSDSSLAKFVASFVGEVRI